MRYLNQRKIEAVLFLVMFFALFGTLGSQMGTNNLISSIMKTAHDLLLNTVFYIMAITVLSSALGQLMIEFGVVRLFESLLAPLMRPLYNLPGVASLGALMTFFSDNPAIISLAKDKNFNTYFKKYELISLTNFGTSFGMGLIVLSFMIGQGFFTASMVGLAGAIFGSIVSTRLMQFMIRKQFHNIPREAMVNAEDKVVFKSEGNVSMRFLNCILDGGKAGVDLGLSVIPGILIITTIVMTLTLGPKDPTMGYQGLAYEGVPIIPFLAGKIGWFFKFFFGFEHAEAIAFPITSLGSVGGSLSLIPKFLENGLIKGNEIAVFTSMGMCWSGFLSTHTAMLDTLGYRKLTSKALLSHTIGGFLAGVFAHYAYLVVQLF